MRQNIEYLRDHYIQLTPSTNIYTHTQADIKDMRQHAVHLITGTRQSDHITPVLRELHWLPVRQRVDFKLALLVFKALHDLTAPYPADDCQLIISNASRCRLQSADIDTCVVPRTNTRLGDRNFAVTGPHLWNSLPAELRQPDIELEEFRRLLKMFLFA